MITRVHVPENRLLVNVIELVSSEGQVTDLPLQQPCRVRAQSLWLPSRGPICETEVRRRSHVSRKPISDEFAQFVPSQYRAFQT